ncbi:MAG TPA: branched-chain amino acid ABC transporter permease [Actinomycetes bacterium]|nr:branched-chain amino acid ABC transporter permease [Actinomycetes bacterium]
MDWGFIFSSSISSTVGIEAVVFCLAAIGINIQFGYTGLLNFGQGVFLAVAGYGLATMVATFGAPFWVGIVVGLLATVVVALLLGIPTLRLRADYLAIVTIAASEIVRLLLRSVAFKDTFGGSDGLQAFSDGFYSLNPFPIGEYGFGPFRYDERRLWVLLVGWGLVALLSLMVYLLMRSPWGRVLKAIREDEDAVRSLGKNVYAFKMQSLVLGGIAGAMGGYILALGRAAVSPDTYSTNLTFLAYTILILGGAARVMGPIVGTFIFWFIIQFSDNSLSEAVNNGHINFLTTSEVAQVRFVLVGLALMLLMIYRPQGILGDRKEIALDAR